jgi:hypothetical protein
LGRSGRERSLGLGGDHAECRGVVDREVREELAVDLDAREAEPGDQAAVGQLVRARRGVDAGDPQRPEIALLGAPVTIGVLAGLDDRLLGGAVDLAPPSSSPWPCRGPSCDGARPSRHV